MATIRASIRAVFVTADIVVLLALLILNFVFFVDCSSITTKLTQLALSVTLILVWLTATIRTTRSSIDGTSTYAYQLADMIAGLDSWWTGMLSGLMRILVLVYIVASIGATETCGSLIEMYRAIRATIGVAEGRMYITIIVMISVAVAMTIIYIAWVIIIYRRRLKIIRRYIDESEFQISPGQAEEDTGGDIEQPIPMEPITQRQSVPPFVPPQPSSASFPITPRNGPSGGVFGTAPPNEDEWREHGYPHFQRDEPHKYGSQRRSEYFGNSGHAVGGRDVLTYGDYNAQQT